MQGKMSNKSYISCTSEFDRGHGPLIILSLLQHRLLAKV